MGAAGDIDFRSKRRGETDLQWRMRIAQEDIDRQAEQGPLVTDEAKQHGAYRLQFVMHIETYTLAYTSRNHSYSPFDDLLDRGTINKDQYEAAMQIQMISERIGRSVSVRGASLEARVDNSGSSSSVLLAERLIDVQLEVAFTRWRQRLPVPRSMILDMILMSGPLFRKARSYGIGWPKARKWLLRSLDNWIDIRDRIAKEIDEQDLVAAYHRLGCGENVQGLDRE